MSYMDALSVVLAVVASLFLATLLVAVAVHITQVVALERQRRRQRLEQSRMQIQLEHLTQEAIQQMLATARLTRPPTAGAGGNSSARITTTPWDIEGEAWESRE